MYLTKVGNWGVVTAGYDVGRDVLEAKMTVLGLVEELVQHLRQFISGVRFIGYHLLTTLAQIHTLHPEVDTCRMYALRRPIQVFARDLS